MTSTDIIKHRSVQDIEEKIQMEFFITKNVAIENFVCLLPQAVFPISSTIGLTNKSTSAQPEKKTDFTLHIAVEDGRRMYKIDPVAICSFEKDDKRFEASFNLYRAPIC